MKSLAITCLLWGALFATVVQAGCPGLRAFSPSHDRLCRDGGTMTRGGRNNVWASRCPPADGGYRTDPVCTDLMNCEQAGAFRYFVAAVTENCHSKSFDGFFGLDGITFGLLDWTANNLITIFEMYKNNPTTAAKFDTIMRDSGIQMNQNCLSPEWVCQKNRDGWFMCDETFRSAFNRTLLDPDLQKVQLEFARKQFEERVRRFTSLGLTTNFGVVSMAVVANNLKNIDACKPSNWKRDCSSHSSEAAMVNCMLDKYIEGNGNGCRNSKKGSQSRADAIRAVFRGRESEPFVSPNLSALAACSTRWGTPSTRTPRATRAPRAHRGSSSRSSRRHSSSEGKASGDTPAASQPSPPQNTASGPAGRVTRGRNHNTAFYRFPPSALRIYLRPNGNNLSPMTVGEALNADATFKAALDGPMFHYCVSEPQRSYSRYSCGTPDYFHSDTVRGVTVPTLHADRGITISINGTGAYARNGATAIDGATVAVQLYPSLIEDGRNTASASRNTDNVWRAGMGITNDGQLIFAVGKCSMNQFADALIAEGVRWAGYTDGGGSARLEVKGNSPSHFGSTENRRVISFLVATQ